MTGGKPVRILHVSGSLRAESANAAVLRTVQAVAPIGVETTIYESLATLPHFNPDDDFEPLPAPVTELRAKSGGRRRGAVLHAGVRRGALLGSFKNLLDWSVGGPEMYEKPAARVDALIQATSKLRSSKTRVSTSPCRARLSIPRG